jgi:hypothetical protein
VERIDMQKYWITGEKTMAKVPIYDPRAMGRARQLVRIPHTIHPRTGLQCVECYGPLELPIKQRHELWHPEENAHLLEKLKARDREPDVVDRSSGVVDFEFSESPKCIRNVLRIMPGHPTHDQAWHLANFMITLGASDEEILNCFKADPRYVESIAIQQIDSIRKSAHVNMGCDKISFIGLCDAKQKLNCPMWPSIDRYLFGEST